MTDSIAATYLRDALGAAERRDGVEREAFDELRRRVDAFLADPPSHCSMRTKDSLHAAATELRRQSDHITAVWSDG